MTSLELRTRSSLLVIPSAVIAGLVVAILSPSTEVVLTLCTLLVIGGPLAWRVANSSFDPFEPYVPFFLAYGAMFVVRPLGMIVNADYVYGQSGTSVEEQMLPMLVLALLGAVAFVIGYHIPLGKATAGRIGRPPALVSNDRAFVAILAISTVALLLYFMYLMAIGGLQQIGLIWSGRSVELTQANREAPAYFSYGPLMLVPCIVASVALYVRTRERRFIVLLGALLALELTIVLPVGSRGQMLPLLGAVVVWWYCRDGRRPKPATVTAVLAIALLCSFIVLEARYAGPEGRRSVSAVAVSLLDDPTQAIRPVIEGPDAEMAHALAASLAVVPSQTGHTYGTATFGDLVTRWVPRAIWPNKPAVPREHVIALMAPGRYAKGVANPEFSALLTPYLDFSYFGAALLFFYGLGFRVLFEWFSKHRRTLEVQLIFALALPFCVLALRDSFTDTSIRMVFTVGPFLALLTFASRGSWPGLHQSPASGRTPT